MEGPQEIIIPEQRYVTCGRCKHYDHSMIQSGNNPVYSHSCKHPEISSVFKLLVFSGNLHPNMSGIVETPDWCPYYGSNTRKVLIEKNICGNGIIFMSNKTLKYK